ncbi:MAG TPA: adenylate/guanylate cyclase domain-containing protein, partial [Egibacteraceae bacterium]|nr:adenylate/guanylate cyclase domain-containing protein [Egibacteraceae bacterium]
VEELADSAGISIPMLRAWESAIGLPSHERYRPSDAEDARLLARLVAYLPGSEVDALVRPFRADGQALQRIAMAHLELVYRNFIQPLRAAGGNDVAVAIALAEAAHALLPLAGPLVGTAYRRIMEHLLSTELVAQATRGAVDRMDLAVAFVDVVGYTSLSARIDPEGLDEVIDAFETRCYTVAGLNERIQLVKFLGDAAMYISTDAVALARAMLDVTEYAEHDSPLAGAPMRAGLAFGECLVRQGDYFGPPVNLAARLTDRARAGTVLAQPDLAETLEGHFALRRLPPIHLRGLGHLRPVAVRRTDGG